MIFEIPSGLNRLASPPLLYLKPDDLPANEEPGLRDEPELEETFDEDSFLLCRQCFALITTPAERIAVSGANQHTFANPHGIIFEIGCFRNAWGCSAAGAPTNEFTWFAGYFWQVAVCASCLIHMGWRFTSPDSAGFYGLILDRLIESDTI